MSTEANTQWDRRYDSEDYLFGTAPAAFLTRHARHLPKAGRVLSVADGEGRNSVWMAEQGLEVTAMDGSPVALDKARRLAVEREVHVAFRLGDVLTWDWTATPYDAVVAIFIQFVGPEDHAQVFAGLDRALKPGGLLMLHGYAPRQVGYGTGGPPYVENMYTLGLLRDAFKGYDIRHQADYDAEITEGRGHSGRSGLIDFIARKPG